MNAVNLPGLLCLLAVLTMSCQISPTSFLSTNSGMGFPLMTVFMIAIVALTRTSLSLLLSFLANGWLYRGLFGSCSLAMMPWYSACSVTPMKSSGLFSLTISPVLESDRFPLGVEVGVVRRRADVHVVRVIRPAGVDVQVAEVGVAEWGALDWPLDLCGSRWPRTGPHLFCHNCNRGEDYDGNHSQAEPFQLSCSLHECQSPWTVNLTVCYNVPSFAHARSTHTPLRTGEYTPRPRILLAIWRHSVTLNPMPYTHRVRCLQGIPQLVAASGVKPSVVLARAGLPPLPLSDPDAWVPRRNSLALMNQAARATGDAFFGLHVGAAISLDQCGAWGKAVQEAPTLRAALAVACRRIKLLHTGSKVQLHEYSRKTMLEYRFLGRTYEDPRHFVEGTLAVAQKILLLANDGAVSACFEHERPPNSSELERVLGPGISFSRSTNGLIFESAGLDEPLWRKRTGPLARTPFHFRCEDLVQAVLHTIAKSMPYGRPTIKDTAAATWP